MKKLLVLTMLLVCGMTTAFAQKPAEIKFDKLTHNFGTFSEKNPVVTCVFTYTNVGEENKTPIKPGEQGQIKVTYNGAGKFPGHFKKSITVRTNGAVEMTRLYVEGDMTEAQ